jgi:selenide,water dikinase
LPFRPQREFLSLVSTGDRYAVASRSRWSIEGRWVWRWKDHIDRVFMRKFTDLPAMDEVAAEASATGASEAPAPLHCAGCGSKVGGRVLRRALARLDLPPSDDVLLGLDSPDDAAVVRLPEGRVAVHTVDHFRALVADPYVFGRITAVHALGDLWAMGATPQSAMAIVTLAYGTDEKMEEDLVQLLAGACAVFAETGTALVGGHTSEGPEIALGFALTGHADPRDLLRKSGLDAGDALILTKPLGTGVLFAAEMRGKARGRWIAGAVESMSQTSGRAAELLRAHGATAMTDVTGFGLAGHLGEMLVASGRGARLVLGEVPLLAGASEVSAAGIASSLQPQNRHVEAEFDVAAGLATSPAYELLFDPQTAGGLLAGVPAARAADAVAALGQAGYATTAVIGEVTPAESRIEII